MDCMSLEKKTKTNSSVFWGVFYIQSCIWTKKNQAHANADLKLINAHDIWQLKNAL